MSPRAAINANNTTAVAAAIAAVPTALREKAAKATAKKKSAKFEAKAASSTPAFKRPAAAPDEEADGKTAKPGISVIKCRSCVAARTGHAWLGDDEVHQARDDLTEAKDEAAE